MDKPALCAAVILGCCLATVCAATAAPAKQNAQEISQRSSQPDDPIEKEYQKLLAMDDLAQQEVDKWIREAQAFEAQGAGSASATLPARIDQRFLPVRKAYEDFLRRHPKHTRARLAYGSFLNDIHDEDAAVEQWEKARELDPQNPAAWNNLANHYGHRGPILKAFEYYEKAITLDPKEPVYLQNLATTVYLFRKDSKEFYNLTEQEVFNKALGLYRKALELDPNNFPLATDLAQTYYGIKPMRVKEALDAWDQALKIANDDIERQGIYVHLARIHLNHGSLEEARRNLEMVNHEMYSVLKQRLVRNLAAKEAEKQSEPGAKNPPAASSPANGSTP